jgi:hypothetical protein
MGKLVDLYFDHQVDLLPQKVSKNPSNSSALMSISPQIPTHLHISLFLFLSSFIVCWTSNIKIHKCLFCFFLHFFSIINLHNFLIINVNCYDIFNFWCGKNIFLNIFVNYVIIQVFFSVFSLNCSFCLHSGLFFRWAWSFLDGFWIGFGESEAF